LAKTYIKILRNVSYFYVLSIWRQERCITDVGHWMSTNQLKLNTDMDTELLWVGLRHSFSQRGGRLLVLHLGHDSTEGQDHVRLLNVTLSSSDLSLDRYANIVSATSFYWLQLLRRSRRSLDTDSATTVVHAFVSSRVDHCNAVLTGAPKVTTDKLQCVLNALWYCPTLLCIFTIKVFSCTSRLN